MKKIRGNKLPGNLYSLDRLYAFVTCFPYVCFIWPFEVRSKMEEIPPPGMYETRGK